MADGTVRGRLRGPRDRALLIPEVYQRTQAAAAVGFFRQNNYIGLRPHAVPGGCLVTMPLMHVRRRGTAHAIGLPADSRCQLRARHAAQTRDRRPTRPAGAGGPRCAVAPGHVLCRPEHCRCIGCCAGGRLGVRGLGERARTNVSPGAPGWPGRRPWLSQRTAMCNALRGTMPPR